MQIANRVHFIGIGGSGMSGLARVLLDMGIEVSGSDLVQKEITEELKSRGAKVYYGHQRENIAGAEMIVYSSDVPEHNVEYIAAQEQQIPLMHRSDLLAQLINGKKGIVVAGSHGKTTTTSLISFLLQQCDIDPTYIIGGEMVNLGSNARFGHGPYVVAEADESDKTFLKYHSYIGIVTNISPDHLENYDGDVKQLEDAFAQFLTQIKPDGVAVLCGDDGRLTKLQSQLSTEVITYGIEREDVHMRAVDIKVHQRSSTFTVIYNGETLGQVNLAIPGQHNIYNALAAIVVGMKVGIPFDKISEVISQFQGAKRRFQFIGDVQDVWIIDDYAVHPTEIRATLRAAKDTGRKVYAVFQPHRMSRGYYLMDDFAKAFADADEVLVTHIYSPKGEKKFEGVSGEKMAKYIRSESNVNTSFYTSHDDIVTALLAKVQPGELVITLGAGDIWKAAVQLKDQLLKR